MHAGGQKCIIENPLRLGSVTAIMFMFNSKKLNYVYIIEEKIIGLSTAYARSCLRFYPCLLHPALKEPSKAIFDGSGEGCDFNL